VRKILFFRALIIVLLITCLTACTSITPTNQTNTDIPSSLVLTDFLILSEPTPAALIEEQEEWQRDKKRKRWPRQNMHQLFPWMSRASPISLAGLN
jgi:hypothetical protein